MFHARIMQKSLLFVLCLVTIMALLACAPAAAPAAESGASAGGSDTVSESPVAAMEVARGDAGHAEADYVEAEAPAESISYAEVDAHVLSNRKIKRNAYLRIEAKDVIGALNKATLLSTRFGGYTSGARTWSVDDQTYASYSFAVPVEQFELALEEMRHLGEVKDENVTSQDVTSQFVDLEARIVNLEATAERIRSFLADAKKVEEALDVNRELSSIEGQLEQLKGQRNALSQQTSFSTISIELVPPPPVPTTVDVLEDAKTWSPVATFNAALEVLLSLAQFGIDLAIWVLVLAGPAAFMLVLALWIGRRLFLPVRRATS